MKRAVRRDALAGAARVVQRKLSLMRNLVLVETKAVRPNVNRLSHNLARTGGKDLSLTGGHTYKRMSMHT